jgi:hypothetical protein
MYEEVVVGLVGSAPRACFTSWVSSDGGGIVCACGFGEVAWSPSLRCGD